MVPTLVHTGKRRYDSTCYPVHMSAAPKWVIDDAASVAEEAAPYIDMPAEQRLVHLAAACRAAARLL